MISVKQEQLLLGKLRAGHKGAVREWFRLYSPYLLRVAHQRISEREDAQDLVQETFINCLKQLPLFRGQARLGTWMISILRHEIADFYRRRYAKKTLQVVPIANLLLAQPVKNASETSLKVRQALTRMTAKRKELLLQKYVDRRRVKDIAVSWQTSVKAIESELFRARREFRLLYLEVL
jgi:RNA polymerase sigma-70 factor (ECF subfamily)